MRSSIDGYENGAGYIVSLGLYIFVRNIKVGNSNTATSLGIWFLVSKRRAADLPEASIFDPVP